MNRSLKTLLSFLSEKNIATKLDDEDLKKIADDVIRGYTTDRDSAMEWLRINKIAMTLVHNKDNLLGNIIKNFPFDNASKIVYPLLGPAIIQMGARLDAHVVRNGHVAEYKVLGKDQQSVDPQTNQPSTKGVKQEKGERSTDYLSYQLLIKSDSWLVEHNKLNQIVSSWGTGFKKVYYDPVLRQNVSEVIDPEDVIINNNVSSLSKAPRITIRQYLTNNDIISKVRSGEFLDIDIEKLQKTNFENDEKQPDPQDTNPAYEFLEQYCYLDLDEDNYQEPYCVIVHLQSRQVVSIYPAFDAEDISIDPDTGNIIGIPMDLPIVDQHGIASPDGKYYSIGLNALLVHICLAINSIVNQLVDAGTLANVASSTGFVTRNFKTRERDMRIKLGTYQVVDLPPNLSIRDQIFSMPFGEPSQVLLGLLQMLIDMGMKVGFMSDILTGDTQTQNTPATTALAAIEQATRAFKPMVQNLHQALKKEFKILYKLNNKYLDKNKYAKFCGLPVELVQDDFNLEDLDIVPVADPTVSSEAAMLARAQLLIQLFQLPIASALNVPTGLETIFEAAQFQNPQSMIQPPQPPPPDPKLLKVQADAQAKQKDQQLEMFDQQLKAMKLDLDKYKLDIKRAESIDKSHVNLAKSAKLLSDAHKEVAQTAIAKQQANIQSDKVNVEHERVKVLASQQRNKADS